MGIKTIGKFIMDSTAGVEIGAMRNVPFSSHKTSDNCVTADGNTAIDINRAGVYQILYNGTFKALNTSPIDVQLIEDGTLRQGAHAVVSPVAVGDNVSVAFSDIITVRCGSSKTIAVQSKIATNVLITSISVVKIA